VDHEYIWLKTAGGDRRFSREQIASAVIFDRASDPTLALGLWTVGGAISTITHGFLLIVSLPTWLIVGGATTLGTWATRQRDLTFESDADFRVLHQYARYPGGMPAHLLRPPPAPPAPTAPPAPPAPPVAPEERPPVVDRPAPPAGSRSDSGGDDDDDETADGEDVHPDDEFIGLRPMNVWIIPTSKRWEFHRDDVPDDGEDDDAPDEATDAAGPAAGAVSPEIP
jgi:hypothetical protein